MWRIPSLLLTIIFLSGCGLINKPTVEKKYDELTKNNVCRLQNFSLNNEFGRITKLNIIREDNNLKSILTITGINYAYDFRAGNPGINLTLYNKDQAIVDQIQVEANIVDIKDWDITTYIYANGIAIPTTTHYSNISFLIPFTKDNLKKIGNTDFIKFILESNGKSMKGKINKADINWFKKFEEECLNTNTK